jgi:putative FmdB family regulatory protein
MPTYEYRCPEGHSFERFYRKISDAAPELACPECGKVAERQLTGGAGLLFKGSGFYLTDYGKNAHRKGPPAGKSAEGGSEKSGEGKSGESSGGSASASSDAKPAAGASADASNKSAATDLAKPSKTKSEQ